MISFLNSDLMLLDFGILSVFLFFIGLWGIFGTRTNVINMLLSLELIFTGLGFYFIILSVYLDDMSGQIFSLVLLVIAAAESSIGLSIFVAYHRTGGALALSYAHLLKG